MLVHYYYSGSIPGIRSEKETPIAYSQEVIDMKQFRLPFFLTLFFCIVLCFSVSVEAQIGPDRGEAFKVQGDIDPYEVTLYRSAGYADPIGTWKLSPGMRMLKIPDIGGTPRSMLLGSKVRALLFPRSDFSALLGQDFVYRDPFPYIKVLNSTPDLQYTGESLIIHRKDISDFIGVYLLSGPSDTSAGEFYPLPEKADESAIIYHKISYGGPFIVEFIHGGADTGLAMQWSPNSRSLYEMEVNITSDNGVTLRLPDPDGYSIIKGYPFDLAKYKVGRISSMYIQYKGPYTAQSYLDISRERAPAAPDSVPAEPSLSAAAVNVAGTWQSGAGAVYEFQQKGATFTWTSAALGQQGSGAVNGKAVTTQWTGSGGSGSATGQITQINSAGLASCIEWNNGVSFIRPLDRLVGSTTLVPAEQLQSAVVDVSGPWKGPMGAAYQFTQNGAQFSWTVALTGEKATGTMTGMDVTAQWSGPVGQGSAKGTIAKVDPGGRASRIEWSNGVVFVR